MGSRPASPHDRSPGASTDRRRRIAGDRSQRWPRRVRALVADAAAFERARRPKPSKLAANAELRGVSAPSWMTIGHRSKSPSGCGASIPVTRRCGSRTSRSTAMCTCRRGMYSTPACFTVCGVTARFDGRAASGPRTVAAGSGTWSPSRERPTEADTREVACHWEGDLVFGARPIRGRPRRPRHPLCDGRRAARRVQGRRGCPRVDRTDGVAADAPAAASSSYLGMLVAQSM